MAPPSGSFLFQYFTKKYTFLDSFIKNIFDTSALGGFRSITSLPHSTFSIRQRNCFPRAVVMKYNCCQVSITTIIIRSILKEPEQVSFNPFPGLYPHFHTQPFYLSSDANLLLSPKTNVNTHNWVKKGRDYFLTARPRGPLFSFQSGRLLTTTLVKTSWDTWGN